MGELLGFVHQFRDLLRVRGIRFAITSGMACVRFGVQQTTKDSDWIVDPGHLHALMDVLTRAEQRMPPWRVSYRAICGAPIDREWMQHGWTSHIEVRERAADPTHHLDFFARPPRVDQWVGDGEGFADRSVVARMKRTDRDRDWPIVDSLGWQLSGTPSGLAEGLCHVQSPKRLRELWQRAGSSARADASRRRPLLLRVEQESNDDRLEAWIRLERLVWVCVNRERYGRYQAAWKAFFRRWRAEPDWTWPTAESFAAQQERLLTAARHHDLERNPLADLDSTRLREMAIERAATMSFATIADVRSVAPGQEEVLT
jgi:hypothetical protein